MGFSERVGCFLLAVGSIALLLFALPIIQAFQQDPSTVPAEWIAAAGAATLVLWTGWKLNRSARKAAGSHKPPSLGARIAGRWTDGVSEKDDDPPHRG
jgi:hypothetical protein